MAFLKITMLPFGSLALLLGSLGFVVSARADSLSLGNPEAYPKKERPPVVFPHESHMQMVDCLDCHHDYAHGENMLDEYDLEESDPAIRCASCHAGNTTVDLKSAYHQQCVGCHHRMRRNGEAEAPELCGECHRK